MHFRKGTGKRDESWHAAGTTEGLRDVAEDPLMGSGRADI